MVKSVYKDDFYSWLNLSHISKPIIRDSHDEATIKYKMIMLLTYLLRWQFQPHHQNKNWEREIIISRRELSEIFTHNDKVKENYTNKEWLYNLWQEVLKETSLKTGYTISNFPHSCSWSLEQILDNNFYPESMWVNYFKIIS